MKVRLPSWSNLRSIGESLPVKASVIAPIIGNYIILNPFLRGFWSDDFTVENSSEIPNIRLYILYFGLTFLGYGSILFQVFCPSYIKRFSDEEVFIRELSVTSTGASLKAQYNQFRHAEDEYAAVASETSRLRFDSPEETFELYKIDVLRSFYIILDKSNPIAKNLCSFLFLFGLAALSVPAIWTLALIIERIISV